MSLSSYVPPKGISNLSASLPIVKDNFWDRQYELEKKFEFEFEEIQFRIDNQSKFSTGDSNTIEFIPQLMV